MKSTENNLTGSNWSPQENREFEAEMDRLYAKCGEARKTSPNVKEVPERYRGGSITHHVIQQPPIPAFQPNNPNLPDEIILQLKHLQKTANPQYYNQVYSMMCNQHR